MVRLIALVIIIILLRLGIDQYGLIRGILFATVIFVMICSIYDVAKSEGRYYDNSFPYPMEKSTAWVIVPLANAIVLLIIFFYIRLALSSFGIVI